MLLMDLGDNSNAFYFFFFNDTATTEIYTLSLHDALPILEYVGIFDNKVSDLTPLAKLPQLGFMTLHMNEIESVAPLRSEEHTSELQSRQYLVCRLLLEKKKKQRCIFLCIVF